MEVTKAAKEGGLGWVWLSWKRVYLAHAEPFDSYPV